MTRHFWGSKWWMPGFSVFLGLLIAGAFLIGGDPWMALWGFLLLAAFAGSVVIAAIIGMWLYEIANGQDGSPHALLGALGGVAYIGGVAWGRFRR